MKALTIILSMCLASFASIYLLSIFGVPVKPCPEAKTLHNLTDLAPGESLTISMPAEDVIKGDYVSGFASIDIPRYKRISLDSLPPLTLCMTGNPEPMHYPAIIATAVLYFVVYECFQRNMVVCIGFLLLCFALCVFITVKPTKREAGDKDFAMRALHGHFGPSGAITVYPASGTTVKIWETGSYDPSEKIGRHYMHVLVERQDKPAIHQTIELT